MNHPLYSFIFLAIITVFCPQSHAMKRLAHASGLRQAMGPRSRTFNNQDLNPMIARRQFFLPLIFLPLFFDSGGCDCSYRLVPSKRELKQVAINKNWGINEVLRDTDDYKMPALAWAIYLDDTDIARSLLTAGANPNLGDIKTRKTPLHIAVENRNARAVELLQNFKADPKIRESRGFTPEEYEKYLNLKRFFKKCGVLGVLGVVLGGIGWEILDGGFF